MSNLELESEIVPTKLFGNLLLPETQRLGDGGYGSVYKCKHQLDKKFYAVKRIGVKSSKLDWSLREVQALADLKHDNIVRYYQSWTENDPESTSVPKLGDDMESSSGDVKDDVDVYLCVQMEFCPSDLDSRLKEGTISRSQARSYFHKLLIALKYIHRAGFLHRDLTRKNIFFGDGDIIKIGDFGLAKRTTGPEDNRQCSHSPHSEYIGAPRYSAPELEHKKMPYSVKSDLYSLGMIFLEMLLHPAQTMSEIVMPMSKVKEDGKFPDGWEDWHETALLRQILDKSPHERPTVDETLNRIDQLIAAGEWEPLK